MVNFGIIAEGSTDIAVIHNILTGYFKNGDIALNPLHPPLDATDRFRATDFSNWLTVFRYCSTEAFRGAFAYNDYVIIHIDTDVSEEKHYEVPRHKDGKRIADEELVQKVIEKFKEYMTPGVYDTYREKIIFAIAIDSTECWLLPLYYDDNRRSKKENCLDTLNQALGKLGKAITEKKAKDYHKISKDYCKHKRLMAVYENNPSLKIFIEEIRKRNIIIEPEQNLDG